jgi:hypothetical protein
MTPVAEVLAMAMRDRRRLTMPLGLWGLITAAAAITGPFQTYDLLAPLPRAAYWGVVAGLSVCLSRGQLWLLRGRPAWQRLLGWGPFAVVLAALLQGLNRAVFVSWGGWPDYLWLLGMVLAVCLLVEAAAMLLWPAGPGPLRRGQGDPLLRLMGRLPPERRGRLIRIEAQDHYLSVVTTAGTALILMRMTDAEALLAGVPGLRVHRSHWVMLAEMARHERREGRDMLIMTDGAAVPVSRRARPAVQRAGLIGPGQG